MSKMASFSRLFRREEMTIQTNVRYSIAAIIYSLAGAFIALSGGCSGCSPN
jgi:hypothetical protein